MSKKESIKSDPEKLDQLFKNMKENIESDSEKNRIQYSIDYPEGWEMPDRKMTIFEFTPFYNVNKPFKISGVLTSLASFKHLKDRTTLENTLNEYVNNRKLKKKSIPTIKNNIEALKTEIQGLIDDINHFDRQAKDHLSIRLEEAINRIEQKQKRGDFRIDMQNFFRTFRSGKPDLDLLFKYDHFSAKDKKRTRAAINNYLDKKEPLVNSLKEKVKTLQIYSRAIELARKGKPVTPKKKRGRKPKNAKVKQAIKDYYKDHKKRLRKENTDNDGYPVPNWIAKQILEEKDKDIGISDSYSDPVRTITQCMKDADH